MGFGSDGGPGPVVTKYNHTLVYGLVSLGEVDVTRACGDRGVWEISIRQNAVSLLATALTAGMYTPTIARITCKG